MKPLINPTATVILKNRSTITNKIPAIMETRRRPISAAGQWSGQVKQRVLPRDRLKFS